MGKTSYCTVNGQIRSEHRSGESRSRDYALDPFGNVMAVYQADWAVAYMSFDPWGERVSGWNDSSYRFTWAGGHGYRQTSLEWATHYVRARHYSFMDGCWTTTDPLWPSEPAYRYVGGRVPRSEDPSGLVTCRNCSQAICNYIGALCRLLQGLSDSQWKRIAKCYKNKGTVYHGNQGFLITLMSPWSCGELDTKRVKKGMLDFCNQGEFTCRGEPFKPTWWFPGSVSGYCYAPTKISVAERGGYEGRGADELKPLDIPEAGIRKFTEPRVELALNFLHEIGHSGGLLHGKRDSTWTCNDVLARCIYEEFQMHD